MIANLVPACDRCGHTTDTDKLAYDGLGMVCGACRVVRKPRRIQLRRTAGWRKPPGVISVARPSKWGNPFTVGTVIDRAAMGRCAVAEIVIRNREQAVEAYRQWLDGVPRLVGGHDLAPLPPTVMVIRAELRGHDLACWCPLNQPCHADVLLELAAGAL